MLRHLFAGGFLFVGIILVGNADRAVSADVTTFDGRWRGNINLDCSGVNAPMDVAVKGGDISGKIIVRGQGEGDGTYLVSGYVDRKGRISDGRIQGPFVFSMSGSLSGGKGKGKFHGAECRGRFSITLEEPAVPAEDDTTAAAPPGQAQVADADPPAIALPQSMTTDQVSIDISGSVVDSSRVVDLMVDGRSVPLGTDGAFSIRRGVPVGETEFRVTALDEWGNQAEKTIRVTRRTGGNETREQQAPSINQANETKHQPNPQLASEPSADNPLELELGDYHALVIGNNAYTDMPRLKTAVADADAISEVLENRYGFTVTKLINATRHDMIGAMGNLRANLSYGTNLLIYYAGHGIVDPVTERGYWLPVDAQPNNSANWVSNDDITDMLKAIPSRHILVVADSCFSGTLTRAASIELETWEDRRAWLKRIVEKRSRTALASGGLEPVADSGGGDHSVFAAALLGALRENSEMVEAQALFAPVRKKVVLNANQTPVYSDIRLAGHDGGDFVFAPK